MICLQSRGKSFFYNRRHSVNTLPKIYPGDTVRIRTEQDNVWSEPTVITSKANTPRSFRVQSRRGDTLRRNCHHLMIVPDNRSGELTGDYHESSDDSASVFKPSETAEQQIPTTTHEFPMVPRVQTRSGRCVKPPDRLDI